MVDWESSGNHAVGPRELITITILVALIVVSCVFVVRTFSQRADASLGTRYESLVGKGRTALAERNFPFAEEDLSC